MQPWLLQPFAMLTEEGQHQQCSQIPVQNANFATCSLSDIGLGP